jgi:hypothetical protein
VQHAAPYTWTNTVIKQISPLGCNFYVLTEYYNNNNKVFYSQSSWGRLEMNHMRKKGTKQERKRMRKIKCDKKPNRKRRKNNKTLSQKAKKDGKNLIKRQ